jgi:ADP-ribose pyrophosphatase
MKSEHVEDHPHLSETLIEGSQIYRGRLLDVRCDRVRLPYGAESTREYVRHQGAVVVIPVLDNGNVILERQFRYPLGRAVLEFPAGKIDPGEAIETTAQRELLEETGYEARDWRYLGVMHPCVGYSDERIEIFFASGLIRKGEQNLDHGELLDLLEFSMDDLSSGIRSGAITDAKTVTAFFWAEKVIYAGW